MFTDIEGYTSLTQSNEAGALHLLQEQERLVRPLLATHRGRKVKSLGDGLLVEFPDALDAVECAVDLQRQVQERNTRDAARPLRLRIGIHLGDIQRRGTDILGDAVNIASRVQALAEPGSVCFSAQVYDQVRNKVPYQLEKLGPRTLKGVHEPVDLYRVVLPWVRPPAAERSPELPRLAVLPLANISPDPQDAYFADGLTEELISVLSNIQGLRVISRTSVNQYRGTAKPIAQIGSELGVSTVLEGSVRKAGNQLRIAVQLIDVPSDAHRWSQTYDRTLENVFAIQAEVAEQTAKALKLELLPTEREALQERPTTNLRAYEAYLRGIQVYRHFLESEDSKTDLAIGYFEEAIRADPGFSAAYSYLGTYLISVMGISRPGREVFPRARELIAKALELNPNSSDAHTAAGNLAMQADLDWKRGEVEFRRAIELNPSSSVAHFWYGNLLCPLQRYEEATREFDLAVELDPLSFAPRLSQATTCRFTRPAEVAIALSEKLLEDFPTSPTARGVLAWAYAHAGRLEDGLRTIEPLAGAPDWHTRTVRAGFLASVGRTEEIRAMLAEYERDPGAHYVPAHVLAEVYAELGEDEKALSVLERDFREGDRTFWACYQSEEFGRLRSHPRFIELLRSAGLPTSPPPHRGPIPARLPS